MEISLSQVSDSVKWFFNCRPINSLLFSTSLGSYENMRMVARNLSLSLAVEKSSEVGASVFSRAAARIRKAADVDR